MRLLAATFILWTAAQCQQRSNNAQYDKLYDDYLNKMRVYADEVQRRKITSQVAAAQKVLADAKAHGWMEDVKGSNSITVETAEAPTDPFGKLPAEKVDGIKPAARADEVCRKFAPSVHLHCRGSTKDKHALRCFSYFRDCASVIPKNDPLSSLAALYATLPKPEGSSDEAVIAPQPSEGFIPIGTSPSPLTSMSSSTPPPLDPPRVMTEVEKRRLDMACRRVMPTATRYCHGKYTHSKLRSSCETYLNNCAHLIPKSNPLYNLAQQSLMMQVIPPSIPTATPSTTQTATNDLWDVSEQKKSNDDPFASMPLPSSVSSPAAAVASSGSAAGVAPAAGHAIAQAASTLTAEQIQEMENEARAAKAELPGESLAVLQKTCERFASTVRKHCVGDFSRSKYANRCRAYYQDCQRFMVQSDPLYEIAHAFDSGVGLNLGSWAVMGIPYYPVNEEGAIGSSYLLNIPFGSWGGGYSEHFGVRDYWAQYQEVGANWYDGKYGYKSGWSVPLVQSLGIEGETHAAVSVPIKPGDLGKPIGVDVGGGVGPYYQQNHHVGVDWMDGQVSNNFGIGVPIAGVGFNTGMGVSFPGAGTWLG